MSVFGDDYDTPDELARDYIHVVDLAKAHVSFENLSRPNEYKVYNIGTGRGTSVLELVKRMLEKASGRDVPYQVTSRRAGDFCSVLCRPRIGRKRISY